MKSTVTYSQVVTRPKTFLSLLASAAVLILMIRGDALAQTFVELGDATSFAVLGDQSVSNAGDATTLTEIDGDVGVSPGTSIVNLTSEEVNGTIYIHPDQPAVDAQTDLTDAIVEAEGQGPATSTLAELGTLVLVSGIYNSGSSMAITTGNLTLNAEGDPNAVWVFQMGSTLTVGSDIEVVLINGAQAANVFWQVGSSATIGTDAIFYGSIMADASVTLNTRAWLCGRALARDASVTLDDNRVILPVNNCIASDLPVELSLFSAAPDGMDVVLHWETLSEQSNSGFEVQYQSENAWEKLAFIPGAGNSTSRLSYQYRVTELGSGTHRFRLKQIDFDGAFTYSSVVEATVVVDQYALGAAYPNPFNLTTTLEYALPRESDVRLSVFDVLGREVKVLVAGPRTAGSYNVVFDASNLPAGAYFYRLQAGGFEEMKAMVVLK